MLSIVKLTLMIIIFCILNVIMINTLTLSSDIMMSGKMLIVILIGVPMLNVIMLKAITVNANILSVMVQTKLTKADACLVRKKRISLS
jgi:hypothetical protein